MTEPSRLDIRLLEAVLYILQKHRGADKRITRNALCSELRWRLNARISDRAMRAAIENARFTPEGALICSTTRKGGGYYMARNTTELEAYLRQDESRCREMWQRCRRQRAAAGLALADDSISQLELI